MITVNTPSGGKTSAYLSVHYPADYDVFALVCIDDHNGNGGFWRKNKTLLQVINDKLQKYCSHQKEFVATAEDPQTLLSILQLEQKIGREITWVRGIGFDDLIAYKQALPNLDMRWCTEYLKIIPIFEFCYVRIGETVEMRIGFRYDESERQLNLTNTMSFPINCNNYGQGRQNWVHDFKYRETKCPLIEDKIMLPHVDTYWAQNLDVLFPEDTGCQFCYWKDPQQIKLNYMRPESKPSIEWANIKEQVQGNRFKKDISMMQIRDIMVQLDFFGGTGPNCKAGICGI
jgi:hypothetical protein